MLYFVWIAFLPFFMAEIVNVLPAISAGKTSPTMRGSQWLQRQFAQQPIK